MRIQIGASVVLLTASAATAGLITELDPSSLPSTQPGWRFSALANDAGTQETSVFSTNGSVLTSNSMNLPFAAGRPGTTAAFYDIAPGTIQSDAVVEMRLTARILASEVAQFAYGFSVSVYGNGRGMSTGFSTNLLSLDAAQNVSFDTTGWNEYVWVGDWAAGTYSLSVNGQLIATRALRSLNESYASLGDGTGTGNAHAEVSHFSVRIIPAPGGAVALAVAGLVSTRRRG